MASPTPSGPTASEDGVTVLVETFLGLDSYGWVGLAFLVFVGLLWRFGALRAIASALDGRAAKVRADLAEAEALRAEAQRLKDQAAADAAIARATRLAEDRIASASRAAETELRARATELAMRAAQTMLEARRGDLASLTDTAIAGLDRAR